MHQKKRRWKFQKLFRSNQQGFLFKQRCTDQVDRLFTSIFITFRDVHVYTHRNQITVWILVDIAAAADVQREENKEGEGAEGPGGFSSGEEMLREFLGE